MGHPSRRMQLMRELLQSLYFAVAKNRQLIKRLLALLLAVAFTVLIGVFVPQGIDLFNDSVFGKVTILDNPELVDALKAAQDKGVVMAVHGYHHEDFRTVDPDTAKELVEKGVAVFEEAGLTPVVWYTAYTGFRRLSESVQQVIVSILPRNLPDIHIIDELGNGDDLLAPEEIWVYTGTYNITQAMIDSNGNGEPIDGKIHNTVTVDTDQIEGATADTALSITQNPFLSVTQTAGPVNMAVVAPNDRIDPGDTIPYTITVYNTGNQTMTMTRVRVSDSLLTEPRLARYDQTDDSLTGGGSWDYGGTYNITQAMIDSNGNGDPIDGKIHNTVTVDTDQTEEATTDTALPITQNPFLSVTQTVGPVNMAVVAPNDRIDPGDTIPYTIKVYNTWNQTMTNVRVYDSLLTTWIRGTIAGAGASNIEYTWGWRDIESFDDPRYAAAKTWMTMEQPTRIMAHFYDWNPFSKQLICDYLEATNKTNIQVRVDDVEYNTPVWKVADITELLDYDKVVRLSFGVIPEGTWMGGDPHISGISVNDIFHFYWYFFLIFAFFPFIFFLFWRILSRKDKKPNPNGSSLSLLSKDNKKPNVSVIIPAYNEEAHISSCLEAIQKQDFRGNMEVIVVNDGSADRTAEIASKYPVNLIDLKTNVGKANALNVGIEHSKGDILVFSDSDSELASSAVSLLVNSLEEHPDAGAVAGNIFINNIERKNNLLKRFQMIEYYTDQEISRHLQSLSGDVIVCPGPLFAVRRELAERVMFNNRSVIEDADFTIEILRHNMKVLREPRAKAYTDAPPSLKSWFNQRKRWWYGNLQLWRIHKQWARKNPWMILNYMGFIIGLVSVVLALLLPYLFSTYNSISLVLLRGIAYAATPMLLFTLLIAPFFANDLSLLLTIIPHTLLYGILKAVTLTYIYLQYIFGRGIKVTFGPRTMLVR